MSGLRFRCLAVMCFVGVICLVPVVTFSSNTDSEYPEVVKRLPPIQVIEAGQMRNITLSDAFDFHGNACPGATMAFMAVRYGLELLYGDDIPELEDLVFISKAPGGPMDLMDLIVKGDDPSRRTWPPVGITSAAKNFSFQFIRKSTMEMVTVRLRDGLWPDDWFELRDKHRQGVITEAEKEKRHRDREYVILNYPQKSFQELFGTPEVHKFVAWGHIEKGEIDQRIRKLRRQSRE